MPLSSGPGGELTVRLPAGWTSGGTLIVAEDAAPTDGYAWLMRAPSVAASDGLTVFSGIASAAADTGRWQASASGPCSTAAVSPTATVTGGPAWATGVVITETPPVTASSACLVTVRHIDPQRSTAIRWQVYAGLFAVLLALPGRRREREDKQ